jgi:hypothetical protein
MSGSAAPRACIGRYALDISIGDQATPMFKRILRSGIAFTGAVCLLIAGYGGSSAAVDCAGVLRMHGLLRWSARQCAFTQYNPEIVEDAKRCFEQLGSSIAVPLMYAGREQFERMAVSQGREATCTEIARKFPTVVR